MITYLLLNDTIDIFQLIPADFYHAFYRSLGRKRVYPLEGFLSALILQKIFSIPPPPPPSAGVFANLPFGPPATEKRRVSPVGKEGPPCPTQGDHCELRGGLEVG